MPDVRTALMDHYKYVRVQRQSVKLCISNVHYFIQRPHEVFSKI